MDAFNIASLMLKLVWPALLAGLVLLIIPDLMRPGLFFGATVDPEFRKSIFARRIRRRYSIAVWIATFVVAALGVIGTFAAAGADWAPVALGALATRQGLRQVPWLLQLIVASLAFARANRAARLHARAPASVVQVELAAAPQPTATMAAAFAIPIASLAVLGLWAALRWPDLPARLAVHWSFVGPDRWVLRTPAAVEILLARHAVVCLLCALLAWGVFHGSHRIATSGEAAWRERRFRTRIVVLLLAAEYFAVFPAWGSLLGLPASAVRIWLYVWPATILVLLARIVLAGQSGSRGLIRGSGAPIGDRTDDRYWAWGLIYFNRADPAFLVEKRFGVGYTFNFAHPFAWVLLTLIAAIPLIGRLL